MCAGGFSVSHHIHSQYTARQQWTGATTRLTHRKRTHRHRHCRRWRRASVRERAHTTYVYDAHTIRSNSGEHVTLPSGITYIFVAGPQRHGLADMDFSR